MSSGEHEEWYWDLDKAIAVAAADRGPGENMLGPYASKSEAEHWKAKVEHRNEIWDEADEEWSGERDNSGEE